MAIEQHPSQISSRLEAVDWSALSRLSGTKDTEFWLYSVSAVLGPRFMFNLPAPLLQDVRSGTGKIAEVGRMMSPVDLYTSAIHDYDKCRSNSQRMSLAEPMALAMTTFVVNQKSWSSLTLDSTKDEKHVLVLDWETKAGPRSAQACFITPSGKIPDKSTLIEVSMAIYQKHYGAKSKATFKA